MNTSNKAQLLEGTVSKILFLASSRLRNYVVAAHPSEVS